MADSSAPVAALEALEQRRPTCLRCHDMADAHARCFSDDDDSNGKEETDEERLLSLVKMGQHPNVKVILGSKPDLIGTKSLEGETLLHLAAANGHVDTVQVIIKSGRQLIRAKTPHGDTALHAAAGSGHIDTVKELVRFITKLEAEEEGSGNKASFVLERNDIRDTAVHVALRKGHIEVASYLIQKHPEVAYELNLHNESPLFLAVKGNHHDWVKELFKVLPGKDVDESLIKEISQPEVPIVKEALNTRNLAMLQILLENIPALINSKDKRGWTPLSYAAYKGYDEEVVYFLEKFPKCEEQRNDDGSFPIHKAARGDQVNVLKKFLSLRPSTIYQKTEKGGCTILHIAHRHGKQEVIAYLKKHHTQELEKVLGNKTIEDVLQEVKG